MSLGNARRPEIDEFPCEPAEPVGVTGGIGKSVSRLSTDVSRCGAEPDVTPEAFRPDALICEPADPPECGDVLCADEVADENGGRLV